MAQKIDPYQKLSLQGHQPIPRRGTYIPAWYKAHEDLAVSVLSHEGEPLGFVIRDVLPERRWAIDPQGRCLRQNDFKEQYLRYLSAYDYPGVPEAEPIPDAAYFVSHTVDTQGRRIPIGFDPHRPAQAPLEAKYNQEGELSLHYLREQQQTVTQLAAARQLQDLLDRKIITERTYREELAKILGSSPEPEAPTTPAPETAPAPRPTVEPPAPAPEAA